MASHCQPTTGKRRGTTTSDTFRSIPTDENGLSAKVGPSTANLTSCDPCTSGVTRCSQMRSRCKASPLRANNGHADDHIWFLLSARLLAPLSFPRAALPSLRHFKQNLAVFFVHRLRNA